MAFSSSHPTMSSSNIVMKVSLILSLLLSQSFLASSQLTFSKSWVAGGGKRTASSSLNHDSSNTDSSSSPSSSMAGPPQTPMYSSYASSPLVVPDSVLNEVVSALQPPSFNDNSPNQEISTKETLYDLLDRHRSLQDLMLKTWTVILKVRTYEIQVKKC
jgi:hypothetical protein